MVLLTARSLGGNSLAECLDLIDFLLGEKHSKMIKLSEMVKVAQPLLIQQFPRFSDAAMQMALRSLTFRIETDILGKPPQQICDEWLKEQSARLGIGLHELIEVRAPVR